MDIRNKVFQIQENYQDIQKQANIMCDLFKQPKLLSYDEPLCLHLFDMTHKYYLFPIMFQNQDFVNYVEDNIEEIIKMPKLVGVQLLILQMNMNNSEKNQEIMNLIENKITQELDSHQDILSLLNIHPEAVFWLNKLQEMNPKLDKLIEQKLVEFFNNQNDFTLQSLYQLLLFFQINAKNQTSKYQDQIDKIKQFFVKNLKNIDQPESIAMMTQMFKLSEEETLAVQQRVIELIQGQTTIPQFCQAYVYNYCILKQEQTKLFAKAFDNAFVFLNEQDQNSLLYEVLKMRVDDLGPNFIKYLQNINIEDIEPYDIKLRLYGLFNSLQIDHKQYEQLYNQLLDVEQLKMIHPFKFQEILNMFVSIKMDTKSQKEILQNIRNYLETKPF